MNNLNPNWKPIQIPKNQLISSATQLKDDRIKVECWDWEEKGEAKHQFIGELYIDMNKLKDPNTKFPIVFTLFNAKHKKPGFLQL
jgi:hypothetical protein